MMRIAFLGLGAIGTPMAVHIAKAHDLTVWNRTGERATAFAAAHPCTVAGTPREAVAQRGGGHHLPSHLRGR